MTQRKKYPFLDLGLMTAPYRAQLHEAAARVIDSGRYVGGVENELFEKELAAITGTPYAVGVSNGLDAIRLIFRALIILGRLKEGDEVIVPANTYIASVLAVRDAGLVPVLAEPSEHTLNIDTSRLQEYLTPRTRAVLTVHLYGRPAYDEALARFVQDNNLILVEDNAQAIGAQSAVMSPFGTYNTGSLGIASAFSFYPTKNIGALGDAGAVTTHDKEIADTVRALANYGAPTRYNNIYEGFNCRLDPIQAAFIRVRLALLEAETAHRRAVAAVYNNNIDNPLLIKPAMDMADGCVWHQYVVRTRHRDAFTAYLDENGVGWDIHYAVPPHRQPCYAAWSSLDLPATDAIADTVVSLPVSSATSLQDAQEIASIINDFRL